MVFARDGSTSSQLSTFAPFFLNSAWWTKADMNSIGRGGSPIAMPTERDSSSRCVAESGGHFFPLVFARGPRLRVRCISHVSSDLFHSCSQHRILNLKGLAMHDLFQTVHVNVLLRVGCLTVVRGFMCGEQTRFRLFLIYFFNMSLSLLPLILRKIKLAWASASNRARLSCCSRLREWRSNRSMNASKKEMHSSANAESSTTASPSPPSSSFVSSFWSASVSSSPAHSCSSCRRRC